MIAAKPTTTPHAPTAGEDRQLPDRPDAVYLDHVGHFVPDHDAASAALAALGFAPTAWTVQTNPDPAGGPPRLTGTGNRCVMLPRGYLEILARTADTPLARQLEAAMARHVGVHLVALAVADAAAERERLAAAGFPVQPLVALRRSVAGPDGEPSELAFSVARVAPEAMAEGRIQYLTHHTETAMWRPDQTVHPNGAETLVDQVIVVPDIREATARWARFLGRDGEPVRGGRLFALERGRLVLVGPDRVAAVHAGPAPTPPFMAGYAVGCPDLGPVRAALARAGLAPVEEAIGRIAVAFPPALGVGTIHFATAAADPPWLDG